MPTTPNGITYTTHTFLTPGGDQALWAIADRYQSSADIPIVVYTHGNSGAYNQFSATGAFAGIRNWLIDNGWAWVESAGGGGSSWGNGAARRSYVEAFAHVNSTISVGDVVVLGRSMGGLVAYWLYLYEPSIRSKAVGLIINSGTTDLIKRIGPPPGDASIRSAFGLAADGSDWTTKLAGYDPMQFPVSAWTGKNVLQLYGTADDTVPAEIHAQAWLDKYADACAVADVDIRLGGDHSTENGSYLQTTAMASFLTKIRQGSITPPIPQPVLTDLYRIESAYLVGADKRLFPLEVAPHPG